MTFRAFSAGGPEKRAGPEVAVGEEVHDQQPDPVEAYRLGLACQDAVLVGVAVPDHILVAEQGNRQVRLGLVGDPDQAQNLAEVGIPEEDGDQDQVRPHAEVVGRVRRFAGVRNLDGAAGR